MEAIIIGMTVGRTRNGDTQSNISVWTAKMAKNGCYLSWEGHNDMDRDTDRGCSQDKRKQTELRKILDEQK